GVIGEPNMVCVFGHGDVSSAVARACCGFVQQRGAVRGGKMVSRPDYALTDRGYRRRFKSAPGSRARREQTDTQQRSATVTATIMPLRPNRRYFCRTRDQRDRTSAQAARTRLPGNRAPSPTVGIWRNLQAVQSARLADGLRSDADTGRM